MKKILKILKWIGIVLLGAFIILVVIRAFHFYNLDKTNEQVAKIHATRLKLSDVMGENLPPDPGEEADKTVAGVDGNQNGIRDDVELAIFKEYPDSAKTRAVLLQYALALQMQMTLPIVNKETVTATVENRSKALQCIWSLTPRDDIEKFLEETNKNEKFIESRQINTDDRIKHREALYEKLKSYSVPDQDCDLDLLTSLN